MDLSYVLNQRVRDFAECLQRLPAENVVPPTVEDWLVYWNDEDTDLVNLRNIDHWLSRSGVHKEVR